MDTAPINSNKTVPLLMAIIGWFALIAQFVLIIQNRTGSVPETILRYFSFFTILTNLLVALCVTLLLAAPHSKWGRFFTRASTITALTVYILIVGLVYNTVLRFQWQPQGVQKLVDELLHSVAPSLCLIYWMIYIPKANLQWRNLFGWMIYPLAYCAYTLLRGIPSGWYPYPFMNVTELGYPAVITNCVYVTLAFFAISALFVGLGRMTREKV